MSTTTLGVTAAPELGDVLPPRKARGKVGMFIYRHPTIFVGGLLLFIILCIGVFAPFLGTVDPTALAPARRTRPPPDVVAWGSYWLGMGPKPPAVQFIFGSDMLGRDVSAVLTWALYAAQEWHSLLSMKPNQPFLGLDRFPLRSLLMSGFPHNCFRSSFCSTLTTK